MLYNVVLVSAAQRCELAVCIHTSPPLNAAFQRIARRDKKAFFSDQCKEIEEDNRMGKTRDLFKKIGFTKVTFHAKIGTIKMART